jgi:transposase-like protein
MKEVTNCPYCGSKYINSVGTSGLGGIYECQDCENSFTVVSQSEEDEYYEED